MDADSEVALQRARSLCKTGHHAEAKTILCTLHQSYPRNLSVLKGLGSVCTKLQHNEEAITYYTLYISIDDKNADIHLKLGQIVSESATDHQQLLAADSIFKKCLDIDPLHPLATFRYGQYKERISDYETARTLYQTAMQLPGGEEVPCIYYHFGRLLMDKYDDIHSAMPFLEKAIRLKPGNPRYQQQHALCASRIRAIEDREFLFNDDHIDAVKVIIINFDTMLLFRRRGECHPQTARYRWHPRHQFGGTDRIQSLHRLFTLTHSKGIEMVLRSELHQELVIEELSRFQLDQYFTPPVINRNEEISQRFMGRNANEIVNVDGVILSDCKTILIANNDLPGLKLIDIEHLERLWTPNSAHSKISTVRLYSRGTFPYKVPPSLMQEDGDLYQRIKIEVDMRPYRAHSVEVSLISFFSSFYFVLFIFPLNF